MEEMSKRRNILIISAIVVVAVVTFLVTDRMAEVNNKEVVVAEEKIERIEEVATSRGKIVVYKSSSCGCCVGYGEYLSNMGFEVEMVIADDMQLIKDKYNIPREMESCHTAVIGDYFIEGHVPIEAIDKMLAEKSEVSGISLPNMPAGSPGMPGTKQGGWQVYSLTDGVSQKYVKI